MFLIKRITDDYYEFYLCKINMKFMVSTFYIVTQTITDQKTDQCYKNLDCLTIRHCSIKKLHGGENNYAKFVGLLSFIYLHTGCGMTIR